MDNQGNDVPSEEHKNPLVTCQKELSNTLKKLAKVERKLEKTQNYNRELIDELNGLKTKLHEERQAKKAAKVTKETQTDGTPFSNVLKENEDATATGTYPYSTVNLLQPQPVEPVVEPVYEPLDLEMVTEDGRAQSIADQLRSAAEQAISISDYVYDEASGLYYDHQTGYYYNPGNKLYYDSSTYTYYRYSERMQKYEFHSQADMSQYEEYYKHQAMKEEKLVKKAKKEAIRNERKARHADKQARNADKEARHTDKEARKRTSEDKEKSGKRLRHEKLLSIAERTEDVIEGQSCEGSDRDLHSDIQSEGSELSSTEDGEVTSSDEEFSSFSDSADSEKGVIWRPPCIRAIIAQSDSMDIGSLHIITVIGGSIGSSDHCAICIPEGSVSEAHCKVTYSEEERCYYLVELGSKDGTYVNANRLSKAEESASIRLSNRDRVMIGSTQLIVHIHPGTDTCADCEPGLIESKLKSRPTNSELLKSKADVEKERRMQLKSLKKKYGLEAEQYKQRMLSINPKYEDKAEKRRQKFGVDMPYAPDEAPSSVDSAISTKNKGHKLLEKMGWKTGESLGRSQAGIVEPIKVDLRLNSSAGLGSQANRTVSMDDGSHLPKARKKAEILLKTQKRFEKAKTSGIFAQVDDDDDVEYERDSNQRTQRKS